MKSKVLKSIVALALVTTLLFSSAAIAAHTGESQNVLVTIKTDKQEYLAADVANVTVQVENRTNQILKGVVVSAKAEHWLLARGSGSNILEVGNMEIGETRTLSFRCVLDYRAPGIRFLSRIFLLFRQLLSRPSAFKTVDCPGKSTAEVSAFVTHGDVPIQVVATVWYETLTTRSSLTTITKPVETTKPNSQDNDPITTVSGKEALASGGVLSYLWDPNSQFYYIEDNPWQRSFGFNAIYDWAAATVVMYYDMWRACFDYDNMEWMIQAWKGQYGFLFIGGEIGVYTREPGAAVLTSAHYNCADDNHLINMEMSIYYDAHDGNGYKKLFTRAYYPHWWCNGFVDGHLADYKFNDRSCLVMIARLSLYDETMTEAFTAALAGCGFRRVDSITEITTANADTYTIVGNDVHFSWKKIDQGYNTR